jgi:hypothetical protein
MGRVGHIFLLPSLYTLIVVVMRYALPSLALLSITTLAAPAPAPAPAVDVEERQVLGNLLGGVLSGVGSVVAGLVGDVVLSAAAKDVNGVTSALVKIVPPKRPSNIADAQNIASKIWASPTGFYPAVATQVAAGLGPLLDGTLNAALLGALPVGENSDNNNNPPPPVSIYPRKGSTDAPYSLSEDALRKAIYIPSGFTYGKVRPILMFPGTGSYGGFVFRDNLRKLLTGSPYADPVWLNVPNAMLNDTQYNSEYFAYAINYISAICETNSDNLAITSWSQGGLDAQWVLKYWPSTRSVVSDFLPVSADFHGTTLADLICLAPICGPALLQQEYDSNYVRSLRLNGGDSAYVPTTSFYSGFFDEVVEPQQGTGASAYMKDTRGVGVTNHEVQRICGGRLGGGFYGHASTLAHPLTYALIVDALTHEGPGRLDRIDVASVCDNIIAPGLDLDDYLATMGLIPVAGVSLLAYPDRRTEEPALVGYADK